MIDARVAATLKPIAAPRRLANMRGTIAIACCLATVALTAQQPAWAEGQQGPLDADVQDSAAVQPVIPADSMRSDAPVTLPSLQLADPDGPAAPTLRAFKPQLTVTTAPVPSLDVTGATGRRVRVDVTGWASAPESSGLGLSLGSSVAQTTHVLVPLAPGSATSDLDMALRWRSAPWSGNRRVDVAAWRRVTPDAAELARTGDNQSLYGARVEMQFSTIRARSRLVPELGAIGFQFDGGAKVSLRAKQGKPMLYYRSSF